MKKFGALLVVLLAAQVPLFAQVGVMVQLNRRNYMLHEHVYACVTLRNNTGKPMMFGERPELQGFVLFDIRDRENRPVPGIKGQEISVTGLYLAPGEVKRMIIPLTRYYNLSRSGKYTVYAYVSHNMLKKEYRSKDVLFYVSEGVEVWKRHVGVPDLNGKNVPGERIYTILSLNEGGLRSYYLQVEDEKSLLAVTRIGHQISYEKFQAEVDMLSRIHLLMPVGPRVFHYMAFNVNGMNLANSYWKTSGTIPMLYRDPKNGEVSRIGGVPARKGIDYRDPREGRASVADILEDTPQQTPAARPDEGVIDLGEKVMPMKAADEK